MCAILYAWEPLRKLSTDLLTIPERSHDQDIDSLQRRHGGCLKDDIPIRLVKRKLGCANRVFEVFLDHIEGPGGETVLDFVVLSPREKSENHVTGVAILPILDGNLGLLQI